METDKIIKYKEIAQLSLTIIIVVAVGLFAYNQFIDFNFKMQLIKNPCVLCSELNPILDPCFERYQSKELINNPLNISISS